MYACITSEEFEKNENYSIFAMCLCQALNYQNEEKDRAYFTFDNFVEFLKDKKFSLEDISKMIKYLLEIKYIVVADRDSDGKEYYRYNFSFIKDCLKHYRFIGIHNKYVEYAFDEVFDRFLDYESAEMYFRLFFYLSKLEQCVQRYKKTHYCFSATSILRQMSYSVTQKNLDLCKKLLLRMFDSNNEYIQVKRRETKQKPFFVAKNLVQG